MKNIFILVVFCLFSGCLAAQDSKHEIRLGAGIWSTTEIVNIFSDAVATGLTAGSYKSDNATYSGAFHLGYKYSTSERIAIGGTFVYENSSSDAYFNNELSGRFKNNYYTLAAEMDYNYVKKKFFSLYGVLGAGATLYGQKYTADGKNYSDNMIGFNYQFSPLCIKLGHKIGGFAELGFGYKGILCVGIFTRF